MTRLILSIFAILIVLNLSQAISINDKRIERFFGVATKSCSGKCDEEYKPDDPCQCTKKCGKFHNCCEDYASTCQSCEGRCGNHYDSKFSCQCNKPCVHKGDCCSDYNAKCSGGDGGSTGGDSVSTPKTTIDDPKKSCAKRCGNSYDPSFDCQCNHVCSRKGDCCADYYSLCSGSHGGGSHGGSTSHGVTEGDLKELSKKLIDLDVNNVGSQIDIDVQESTTQCDRTDKASRPLFANVQDTVWTGPTVSKMMKLFDNYHPETTSSEPARTAEQKTEEDEFIDAVLATSVMNETLKFLNEKKVFTGGMSEFKNKIREMWFHMYDRDGNPHPAVESSSGFEHVFVGELKRGKVGGFHSFYYFVQEERKGNVNYLGKLSEGNFGESGMGITGVFTWKNTMKCIGSLMVGTSPELDMAVYTVCFLTRPGKRCHLQYKNQAFSIQTYKITYKGVDVIATAYPDWG